MVVLLGFWRHWLEVARSFAVPPGCRPHPDRLPLERLSDHQLRDLGLPPRDPPRSGLWPPGRA